MKCLTTANANEYLNCIGMQLGHWNQLTATAGSRNGGSSWVNYKAPCNSCELLTFSEHVAGWLPKGEWKIFQIDNSGSLDAIQVALFGRLLFGSEEIPSLIENRTFLFEFGKDENANQKTELLMANLIYLFLLFESHGYVVSSGGDTGQYLAIQDGFVYFYSNEKAIPSAKLLLENFERQPLMSPQWILDILIREQEQRA